MHNREFWAKHVEGWRQSGQIAREYAASVGINPLTLKYMKCVLKKQTRRQAVAVAPKERSMPLVEVLRAGQMDRRFELELAGGKRIRIPSSFEADALRRLLGVLEGVA